MESGGILVKRLQAVDSSLPKRRRKPAESSEEQENRMISLAMALAEKKMIDGTASNQMICYYLRLGSSEERLKRQMMEKQKELIDAKTETLKSAQRTEELYANALKAMRRYGGRGEEDDDEDI